MALFTYFRVGVNRSV